MRLRTRLLPLLFLAPALGCTQAPPPAPPAGPPAVQVSRPVKDDLVTTELFTGRTQSVNRVDLRARVTGYLDKIYVGRLGSTPEPGTPVVEEGDDVKAGQVLFVLQQRPFEDALEQARRNLEGLRQQRDFNARDAARLRNSRGGVAAAEVDRAETALRTSESAVAAAAAAVGIAEQNLEWTTLRAPFDGRIGKRQADRGTTVKADDTILASLEQVDPLYAYFDVDERTVLRIREWFPEGRITRDAAAKLPLTLWLANEKPEGALTADAPGSQRPGPPLRRGTIQFADNKIDPNTGTLRVWGLFENPTRDLKSGMFVRVLMAVGPPEKGLFVAEAALGSDQGTRYLFVLNDKDEVVYTPVRVGQRKGGLIEVKPDEGASLREDDRVVVVGLQRVRPGARVQPEEVPMPRAQAGHGGARKPAADKPADKAAGH